MNQQIIFGAIMDTLEFVSQRLLWLIPLILSITVHEWAHAASAAWLGDDTARLLGRNTLNPLAHVDPVGTLLLPLLGVPFGWARPVPVNPVRFRSGTSMKLGVLMVALAGPVSNVVLALACHLIRTSPLIQAGTSLDRGIATMMMLNVSLALFNMLPIHLADQAGNFAGSRLSCPARFILSDGARPAFERFFRLLTRFRPSLRHA
jgi:Zn-dependent protease